MATMSEPHNHDEFLKHFLPMQTSLRGYLLAVLREPTATDDLFQEVALVLWQKFGEFDPARSFSGWAFGVAKIQILRRRRAFARSRLVFTDDAVACLAKVASEDTEPGEARRQHLASCLGKLPPNHKTVVTMRFEQKQSLAEIAANLQKNVAAVEMMMVRIRRWLRGCVEKSMALDGVGAQ